MHCRSTSRSASKTALPNYILSNLSDRMEMAHSVVYEGLRVS
jgi:hypothetical protein